MDDYHDSINIVQTVWLELLGTQAMSGLCQAEVKAVLEYSPCR